MQKIDERGKFFTERISKQRVEVVILTAQGRVRGHVHVSQGQRIKDLLNNHTEQFIAVTEATISGHDGLGVQEVKLIVFNKEHIMSVIPLE